MSSCLRLLRRLLRGRRTPMPTPTDTSITPTGRRPEDMQAAAERTFKSILRKNYNLLSRCLVVSDSLLFKLRSIDYLEEKFPHIRRQTTQENKVAKVLEIFYEVPDSEQQSVYSALLAALRQDGQEHVANIFIPTTDARPMSDEHYQRIIEKREILLHFINPTYALMDILVHNGLLNESERKNVMSKLKYTEMSFELVNILQRKPDSTFDTFIDALKATEQHNAVDILTGEERTFKSILRKNYNLLSRCLVVSDSLLFKLRSIDYVEEKVPNIRRQTTQEKKVAEVLGIFDEVPDSEQQSVCSAFLAALRQDGQEHVANIFIPTSDARPMSDEHYQQIIEKRDELIQFINPTYALMGMLVHSGLLNEGERENVMSKLNYTAMSFELVTILQRKSDSMFDTFIEVLTATEEHHVVYILTGEGDERPLSRLRRKVLIKAREDLIRKVEIQCSTLVARMLSNGVLNEVDLLHIEARERSEDKTAVLIDAIARKSQSA